MGSSNKGSGLSSRNKLIAATLPAIAALVIPILLSLIYYWASPHFGLLLAGIPFLYLLITFRHQLKLLKDKKRISRQLCIYKVSVISVFITAGLSQILVFLNSPDAVFSSIPGLLLVMGGTILILSYGFLWWHTLSNACWLQDVKILKRLGKTQLLRAFPWIIIVVVDLALALYISLIGDAWV